MAEQMYTVWHRNGIGEYKSQWFSTLSNVPLADATHRADDERDGAVEGWFADVQVLPVGENPNQVTA
ncbi:MAG: hypothetical protein IPO08_23795 [Xanthomonadales bacterium]|nr:hypothetical protein [Xanthomonadales bacterium]